MRNDEADYLAKRIINMWRGGPPLAEWVEFLTELDAGQAGTVFARLTRTREHAPTIATFLAEYRALDTHDASNRPTPCPDCDHGRIVIEGRRAHDPRAAHDIERCEAEGLCTIAAECPACHGTDEFKLAILDYFTTHNIHETMARFDLKERTIRGYIADAKEIKQDQGRG